MSLARGAYYANQAPGASAACLLVLSEDDWNRVIPDGIAVPLFDLGDEQRASLMLVRVTGTLFADCTKIQTVDRDFWGDQVGACPADVLSSVEAGARAFLSITQLQAGRACAPAKGPPHPQDWWPHQGLVRYADGGTAERKMFAVLSEDAWNEIARSWTTVRLTSKTKGWRARWEVPVTGGWVVAADLYATPRDTLDPNPPRRPRPPQLTQVALSQIASRVALVLDL